ncbi:helix-turn-helix domain-containing protein [Termitidicoccus mucosus]|uniref:HTH merR-type domain-containing protein n=1 Tax=Termitidicoccus mucosus TaxID=1184151 RepID=A0A178IFT0_9BACT|nr:hypothetical protein AW736_17075 [Opitutaceae bacterium TSB47]
MQNTTRTIAASAITGAASANNTAGPASGIQHPLTDINGLRMSGIFPKDREPSIRTLRAWTQERRIPHHRLGHFVYYDLTEVEAHIRVKLLVPPRH